MTGRLKGKVTIVTGAANGMGAATTKLFAEEGAMVIAVDMREADLAQWDGVDGVVPVVADLTQQTGIDSAVDAAVNGFGRLDAVCNIAGINDLSYPLEETDDVRWDRVMDIDLKAPFRMCRRCVPEMLKNGGGAIVNIGSYAALRGNHGPSYTAAKAGVEGLTKSIAFAYGGQGIRANVIHPGGTMTDIGAHSGGDYHAAQAKLSGLIKAMPVNWMMQPTDIARAYLFLVSDDAEHINGAALSVDGGMCVC